jgi:hypothetical protein
MTSITVPKFNYSFPIGGYGTNYIFQSIRSHKENLHKFELEALYFRFGA